MGFSWSSAVAQDVSVSALLATGLPEDLILSDVKPNKLSKLSKNIVLIKSHLLKELENNECQNLMPHQGFKMKQLNQKLRDNDIEIERYEVLLKGILKKLLCIITGLGVHMQEQYVEVHLYYLLI
jgi:hypothetical protein